MFGILRTVAVIERLKATNDAMHHNPMTNTISSMVFAVRLRLLLETWHLFETRLLLEQMQSDPRLVLEETR